MRIDEGLRAYLLADPAIATIVVDRVHPLIKDQYNAGNAIVYQEVAAEHLQSLDGVNQLTRTNFVIKCMAKLYDDAINLSNLVFARLHNGGGNWGGMVVQSCRPANVNQWMWDEGGGMYVHIREYVVWYVRQF